MMEENMHDALSVHTYMECIVRSCNKRVVFTTLFLYRMLKRDFVIRYT